MALRVPTSSSHNADWQRKAAGTVNQLANAVKTLEEAGSGYQPLDDQLTDLAALDWTGNASKYLRVKSDESGFELITLSTGWTEIATSTPTGTGTVTWSSIPQTYADLLLVINGLSANTAATPSISVSDDGTNFSSAFNLYSSLASADLLYCGVFIPGYRYPVGVMSKSAAITLGTRALSSASGAEIVWRMPGAITAVRVVLSTGNWDAGSLTLYGR